MAKIHEPIGSKKVSFDMQFYTIFLPTKLTEERTLLLCFTENSKI